MKHTSTQHLLEFINDYKLRKGQVIIFNAAIFYYKNNPPVKIKSEVQVITLPNELVLYIVEFCNEAYHIPEMYSTAGLDFRYSSGNALEIWDETSVTSPILSIQPVAEGE